MRTTRMTAKPNFVWIRSEFLCMRNNPHHRLHGGIQRIADRRRWTQGIIGKNEAAPRERNPEATRLRSPLSPDFQKPPWKKMAVGADVTPSGGGNRSSCCRALVP